MVGAGARFVVVGGFAVIANRFVRATEDVDLRSRSPASPASSASSASTDRPRDRNDLLALAEIHGNLPEEDIPGVE